MTFFEKDLEEIMYEAGIDMLCEKGLPLFKGSLHRQVNIGRYGIADLIYFSKPTFINSDIGFEKGTIKIFELKKEKIGIAAFLQAVRYTRGIQRYLEMRDMLHYFDFEIILIGKTIDNSGSFLYLPSIFNGESINSVIGEPSKYSISFFTYSYSINGLDFKKHDRYKLINEGF